MKRSPLAAQAMVALELDAGALVLPGDLEMPATPEREGPGGQEPIGLVLFVHGSGSSRFSGRNRAVATLLRPWGLATLLFDLLSPAEEHRDHIDASLRFAIPLLAERTIAVVDDLGRRPSLAALPLALFGASTGAAAALLAAAARPERIRAVVSRGGRPDLAAGALARVGCPTLLLVGSRDHSVLELNRQAAAQLGGPRELQVVPGASHLFEEPGSLEQVGARAGAWLSTVLTGHPRLSRAPANDQHS